ncbi:hypothetical protein PI124_g13563 [Phytophthora idaei]|nr:hypothetical protein PI125_g13247 [Phytophthora idaei]KAG3148835.1 hypothetical protein PI126_g12286 [Phytophthora idaei]KAG3241573.1 hypothetical protein PI124_g13563 [Phytophthora idaei]
MTPSKQLLPRSSPSVDSTGTERLTASAQLPSVSVASAVPCTGDTEASPADAIQLAQDTDQLEGLKSDPSQIDEGQDDGDSDEPDDSADEDWSDNDDASAEENGLAGESDAEDEGEVDTGNN